MPRRLRYTQFETGKSAERRKGPRPRQWRCPKTRIAAIPNRSAVSRGSEKTCIFTRGTRILEEIEETTRAVHEDRRRRKRAQYPAGGNQLPREIVLGTADGQTATVSKGNFRICSGEDRRRIKPNQETRGTTWSRAVGKRLAARALKKLRWQSKTQSTPRRLSTTVRHIEPDFTGSAIDEES